jgi:hypothetical protein
MGIGEELNLLTIKTTANILKISEQSVKSLAQAGILELVYASKRSPRITERSVRTHITKQIPNTTPANTEPRERSPLSLVDSIETKKRGRA